MHIYTFRAISQEAEDFVLEIELRSDHTFHDFHKSIQEELNYDTSQMASFYLTNYKWEKEKEVTLFEMFSDNGNGNGMLKMDTTLLEDYLKNLLLTSRIEYPFHQPLFSIDSDKYKHRQSSSFSFPCNPPHSFKKCFK